MSSLPRGRFASSIVIAFALFLVAAAVAQTSITTYHYDNYRTGWNKTETVLSPANVWSPSFGLLHAIALDEQVDAQPLVVPGVSITAGSYKGTTHDVVYVATENNTVYAIDVHNGTVLLSANFGTPVPMSALPSKNGQPCGNNGPNVGITSTPVIDPVTKTLYVMTYTNDGPTYRLHALSIGSLTEVVNSNSPLTVSASHSLYPAGTYTFNATYQRQRPALLLVNGHCSTQSAVSCIYAGFGSFCDYATNLSRGWLLGWSVGTSTDVMLEALGANQLLDYQETDTNNYFLSSIWMSGYGPAADDSGNVLFVTGNSEDDSYTGTTNIQESVVKVSPSLTSVLDLFTPDNWSSLDHNDNDFGSGGVLVLPDQSGSMPHLAVAAGKVGTLFLMNEDNLGGYSPSSNNVLGTYSIGACWCGQSYYVGYDSIPNVVTSGGSTAQIWQLQTSPTVALSSSPLTTPSLGNGIPFAGFFTTISSNNTSGTVIWALARPTSRSSPTITLYAFDPRAITNWPNLPIQIEQLVSLSAGSWPNLGGDANLIPVVANGQVFVASNKQLQIFGLTTANKGSGTITFSGSERSAWFCPASGCFTMYDGGSVSVTINGHTDSTYYGDCSETVNHDTPVTVATRLAAAINADSAAYVNAGADGGSVYFVSKTTGANTDYSFTANSATNCTIGGVFSPGSTSFPVSPTSGTMTGGH